MASGSKRVFHADFAGIDNSKAVHLTPEGTWKDLINIRPYDGVLEQTDKLVKNYEINQIRANAPTSIKVFESVYDESDSTFKNLCVTETQAWLQDSDALLQTSGTAPIASEQVEVPVMLKSLENTQYTVEKLYDFSVDVDGLNGIQGTASGDNDAVTDDDGVSYDDCWCFYAAGGPVTVAGAFILDTLLDNDTKYRFSGKYLIPSSNTNCDGIIFNGDDPDNQLTTVGKWTEFDIIQETRGTGTTVLFISETSGGSQVFNAAGSPTDDQFYLRDFEITSYATTTGLTAVEESEEAQCLITGFNSSQIDDLYPSLGDSITVEITSPTTFALKGSAIPNGSYGSSFTIDRSVAIPDTDFIVYFYKETQNLYDSYNVGDSWTYTRSELPFTSNYNQAPFSVSSFGYNVYFSVTTGDILHYKDGVITSVGYEEAVTGRFVHLFANKLFVGKYGLEDDYVLRWSDYNDIDLFYKDLQNGEAGENNFLYTFKGNQQFQGITGISSYLNKLYVFFPSAIHQGTYVGNPISMYFEQFKIDVGSLFPCGPVIGHLGLYFISDDLNFYLTDGNQVISIGEPVKDEFQRDIVKSDNLNFPKVWQFYDDKKEEINWIYPRLNSSDGLQFRIIVFNEKLNSWYFRNLPNSITDVNASEISSVVNILGNESRLLWGAENYIYRDYRGSDCRVNDVLSDDIASSTPAITVVPEGVIDVIPLGEIRITPTTTPASTIIAITKDFIYNPSYIHELNTFIIDAFWNTAKEIEVYGSFRELLSEPVNYELLGTWTPESRNQQIDIKQKFGKVFRYKFIVKALDTSAVIDGFKLYGFVDDVYIREQEQ